MGLAVVALGIVGAAASIYGRRTRLQESTRFWGDETILALQLGERLRLLPKRGKEFEAVELTGMPGLGHLRHSLLDERTFDWSTEDNTPVVAPNAETEGEFCITLNITDPTGNRFDVVDIDLDLAQGWVGLSDQPHRVRIVERKRSGLRNFLETIMNKENNRYDLRPE